MISITDSIERIIANRKDLGGRKYFYWSFPRQTGVTTYLGTYAIQLALTEVPAPRILLIATNSQAKKDLITALSIAEKTAKVNLLSNIDVYTGSDSSYKLRGKRYDYIFMDTPTISGEFFSVLYPLIAQSKFTLHIDSTEG